MRHSGLTSPAGDSDVCWSLRIMALEGGSILVFRVWGEGSKAQKDLTWSQSTAVDYLLNCTFPQDSLWYAKALFPSGPCSQDPASQDPVPTNSKPGRAEGRERHLWSNLRLRLSVQLSLDDCHNLPFTYILITVPAKKLMLLANCPKTLALCNFLELFVPLLAVYWESEGH